MRFCNLQKKTVAITNSVLYNVDTSVNKTKGKHMHLSLNFHVSVTKIANLQLIKKISYCYYIYYRWYLFFYKTQSTKWSQCLKRY